MPSSFDSATRTRFSGPFSRMYATTVPSVRRSNAGWILPKPASGLLPYHDLPSSSLMAMSDTENVSVYSGSRMRPEGSTNGLQRGCQPSRLRQAFVARHGRERGPDDLLPRPDAPRTPGGDDGGRYEGGGPGPGLHLRLREDRVAGHGAESTPDPGARPGQVGCGD